MNTLAPATSYCASTKSTLVDPLLVFVARVEALAILFAAGEFGNIQTAVDQLQSYAAENGLIDRIGQDAVQHILAHSFRGAA